MPRISGETLREDDDDESSRQSPSNANSVNASLTSHGPSLSRSSPDIADTTDLALVFTAGSDDTLVDQITVFGIPVLQFNCIKLCPIVSQRLQGGAYLYPLNQAVLNGDPYIVHTKWGLIFKPGFMLMVFPDKQVACKVYFKLVSLWMLYYRLEFGGGEDVYLYCNSSNTATVDFVLRGTKLRVMGLAGGLLGSRGRLRVMILRPDSPTLNANVVDKRPQFIQNELYDAVATQNRVKIAECVADASPLVNVPVASFVDDEGKLGKFIRHGYVKCFSCGDEELEKQLMAALLVIREQENRKFRGSNPPSKRD